MSEQVCAIVGTGQGISMAVARRFGKEGYKLALIARNREKLNGYVSDLASTGITANGITADASDSQSLRAAFDRIKESLGNINVLVYNAAASTLSKPSMLDAQTMMDNFKVSVAGALVSAQQVIPDMRIAGNGTILFTGGGLALSPHPDYASLAIGKAGIRNLAYSLGAELESEGIFVGTVTIAGSVKPGTHFDPDVIAEKYWLLHTERTDREIVFD